MIKVEFIVDGWLKQENWNVPAHQAKERARRLLETKEVEYIMLIDPDSRHKLMYIQKRGAR